MPHAKLNGRQMIWLNIDRPEYPWQVVDEAANPKSPMVFGVIRSLLDCGK